MSRMPAHRPQTADHGLVFIGSRLWSAVALFLLSSFIISCTPSQTVRQPQTITAYSTSSAQPWMNDFFACAEEMSVTVKISTENPQIYLRIGEAGDLLSPAYKIDEEEILVVTNRESPLQNLSLAEVQALFSGSGDSSVQVWVYPSELDLQRLFDPLVMQERSVAPSARVAANPQQMSDSLNSESNAVGILPARWKTGSSREIYSLGVFPVLALLREEPQGGVLSVLACLQKN